MLCVGACARVVLRTPNMAVEEKDLSPHISARLLVPPNRVTRMVVPADRGIFVACRRAESSQGEDRKCGGAHFANI